MSRSVDDGYSDDGLFSDEDVKPPPSYNLQKRRNAFCVTLANAQPDDDWQEPPRSYLQKRRNAIYELPPFSRDLVPEETRVMAFMKGKGLTPYFPPARASTQDDYISSDEDEVYFSKRSDKSQQTSIMRNSSIKPETVEDHVNWKAIADAEYKMKRRLPGFLKHRTFAKRTEDTAPGYASTGTSPRSGDTPVSPMMTSGGNKARPTGAKAFPSLAKKSDFRVM